MILLLPPAFPTTACCGHWSRYPALPQLLWWPCFFPLSFQAQSKRHFGVSLTVLKGPTRKQSLFTARDSLGTCAFTSWISPADWTQTRAVERGRGRERGKREKESEDERMYLEKRYGASLYTQSPSRRKGYLIRPKWRDVTSCVCVCVCVCVCACRLFLACHRFITTLTTQESKG